MEGPKKKSFTDSVIIDITCYVNSKFKFFYLAGTTLSNKNNEASSFAVEGKCDVKY